MLLVLWRMTNPFWTKRLYVEDNAQDNGSLSVVTQRVRIIVWMVHCARRHCRTPAVPTRPSRVVLIYCVFSLLHKGGYYDPWENVKWFLSCVTHSYFLWGCCISCFQTDALNGYHCSRFTLLLLIPRHWIYANWWVIIVVACISEHFIYSSVGFNLL